MTVATNGSRIPVWAIARTEKTHSVSHKNTIIPGCSAKKDGTSLSSKCHIRYATTTPVVPNIILMSTPFFFTIIFGAFGSAGLLGYSNNCTPFNLQCNCSESFCRIYRLPSISSTSCRYSCKSFVLVATISPAFFL